MAIKLDEARIKYLGVNSVIPQDSTSGELLWNTYLKGKTHIALSNNDVANKNFIIGVPNNKYLSVGGSGIQAYTADGATGELYINYNGGTLNIGASASAENTTGKFYGSYTYYTAGGFIYQGIESASADIARPIWFGKNSDTKAHIGTPMYSTKLTYNPSTNTINFTKAGCISGDSTLSLQPTSTLYLKSGSGTSLIFQTADNRRARFDPNGHFVPYNNSEDELSSTYCIGSKSLVWANMVSNKFELYNLSTIYGRLNISKVGTATERGSTTLSLGNAIAEGTDKNSRGIIWLYAPSSYYTGIYSITSTKSYNYYFRDHRADGYSVITTNTSAVGSDSNPIYVNDWGIICACGNSLDVNITGNANTANSVVWSGVTNKPSYYDAKAIKSITRSGTTFTATHLDGTTSTFTQQDNNTTYTFINKNATLSWGTTTTIATVGDTDITVKLPDEPDTSTTYSQATSSALGLVKIGYTTSGKNYPVQLNTDGQMYVNVPWTDSNTTYTFTNKGATLNWGTTTTIATVGGTDITVKLPDEPDTSTTYSQATSSTLGLVKIGYTTSGKNYSVQLNSSGQMYVNVPWTDSNTTYTFTNKGATLSWGTTTTIATVGGTDITVKLPANPNSNTAHAHSAGNGITLTGSGGTSGITTIALSDSFTVSGTIKADKVYGAVWNDYAEYRWVLKHPDTDEPIQAGRCVAENGNDSLSLTHERLQPGAKIISDTYGMCMGETEKAKTPIAVCGRVLAYPFERKVAFNVGDAVCSGPNGTVSKMSREEIMIYPERIVGTVVSKPTYKEWGPNKIPINGRIWIQVK